MYSLVFNTYNHHDKKSWIFYNGIHFFRNPWRPEKLEKHIETGSKKQQCSLIFPKTGIQKQEEEVKLDIVLNNRYRKTGMKSKTFDIFPE